MDPEHHQPAVVAAPIAEATASPARSAIANSRATPSPLGVSRPLTVRFADYDRPASSSSIATVSSIPVSSPSSLTPPALSSGSSSPPHLSSGPSTASLTPSPQELVSPPSSAFVSASASPFSPPFTSSVPGQSLPKEGYKFVVPQSPALESNGAFLDLHFETPANAFQPASAPHDTHEEITFPVVRTDPEPKPIHAKSFTSSYALLSRVAPPTPIISTSPSSSFRPRTCDVYIGLHGQSSSLSRFSKWLRAELEFQGIACFLADRARYSDTRSHDIARRIIESCTFGVLVINKKTFRNLYSIEELQIFLERKNLVPLFFDLAPSDCLARDIVEKRGEVWEKEGGDLWRLFGGKEREWREAVDGLSRFEEWKLEAFNGNWRDCILRAVSLLGTRLGRRSVAERERARKHRVEREEFPFPRNTSFAGRDKELRAIEELLLGKAEDQEGELDEDLNRSKQPSRSQPARKSNLERWPRHTRQGGKDDHQGRRRSDADRWQSRHMGEARIDADVTRRKSDSDRWQSFVADGELEFSVARRKGDSERWYGKEGESFGATNVPWKGDRESGAPVDVSFPQIKQEKEYPGEVEQPRGRSVQRLRDAYRSRNAQRESYITKRRQSQAGREISRSKSASLAVSLDGGRACISGGAGMGKTELVLEFAYRFSQKYRMVLWIGGEARYFRQNYLNLSVFLGLDVGTETQVGPERGRIRTFDEQEREAFQRVRRELQRDVPYLLVIDNLESERDWWDRKEVSELLPRPGGATHVVITTRLPKIMDIEPLKLMYLSGVDALSLMKGKREFSSQELDALKEIEDKLDRLTFGLGLVGKILSELPIMPSVLLEKINKGLLGEWTWGPREEVTLKNNSFLVKLLGVCFSFVDQLDGPRKLASRVAWVGGWFAPFPIPISLLGMAAMDFPEQSKTLKMLRDINDTLCCCGSSQTKRSESDAGALLVKFGLARSCSRQGWIVLNQILQLYARKRGGVPAAKAMVQGIKKRGVISSHSEHFWAACFLVFGFGNDPVVVELKVVELLSFIKKGALQLAFRAFTTFSRCRAALELLRLCTNMLEDVEKSFVSQTQDWWGKSLCWRKGNSDGRQVDEYVWQQATVMKALLLETRAKLLLKGGQFDAGEELCRTCISIRTVMLGEHHPDTISAQETLAKLVRARSNT